MVKLLMLIFTRVLIIETSYFIRFLSILESTYHNFMLDIFLGKLITC